MSETRTTFEQYEWVALAACVEDDAPPMFPYPTDFAGIELAKSTCGPCPVRDQCLAAAIKNGEAYGVWGGMTPEERRQLKKRQSRDRANERRRKSGSLAVTVDVVGDVL